MKYVGTHLDCDIRIDEVFTVHYFEYTKNFHYLGESHDFWECVYVDRGEIIATADTQELVLGRGEILFHRPNEWHTLRANGQVAPNLVVFSFSCLSPAMAAFACRHMRVGNHGRRLISAIIRESESVFATPLGDPGTRQMTKRPQSPVGAEQLIRAYMEELLIFLLRADDLGKPQSALRHHADGDLFTRLTAYMQENLGHRLALSDLARCGEVSESTVKSLFRRETGMGAMTYFIRMKVAAAQAYIRESNYNLTQISDLLGYEGIHYFSRQFRAVVGMSPSEYARSIRALEDSEKAEE